MTLTVVDEDWEAGLSYNEKFAGRGGPMSTKIRLPSLRPHSPSSKKPIRPVDMCWGLYPPQRDDPDAGETFTYHQGGPDAGVFSIGGAGNRQLILDDGIVDDADLAGYSVIVQVINSQLNTYNKNDTGQCQPGQRRPVTDAKPADGQ